MGSTNVYAVLFSSQEETESAKAGDVTEKKKLFKDLQENVDGAGRKLLISECNCYFIYNHSVGYN